MWPAPIRLRDAAWEILSSPFRRKEPPMLFKKDYERAAAIVRDVRKVNKIASIIVEQAFVDFFSETPGKFDAEKFHDECQKTDRKAAGPKRSASCPEGGDHEFTPDIEYDPTGETLNCCKGFV